MACQLLEVLAQSDAACILAARKQLLSAQATGHKGVTNGLGLSQSHPPPQGSRPSARGLGVEIIFKSAGGNPESWARPLTRHPQPGLGTLAPCQLPQPAA